MENRTFYNEILTDHNLHPLHKEKLPDATGIRGRQSELWR